MIGQIVNGVIGLWLMFAPAVLGHADTTLSKFDRAFGPAIAAAAVVAIAQITRSVRWLNLALAPPLIIAPWFIDAPTGSKINSAVAGIIVLALTPMGHPDQRRYGNGWTSLWRNEDLPPYDAPTGEAASGGPRT